MLTFHTMLVGGKAGETIRFEASGKYAQCRLRAYYRGQVVEATATDFFDALCQIRDMLTSEGLCPLCHGASLDVHPIGHPHKLNSGLLAYRLSMAQSVSEFDIVETFGCETAIKLSTVAEQRDYYAQWLQSTG